MTKHISKIHLWIAVAGGALVLAGCSGQFHEMQSPTSLGYPKYPLTNQLAEVDQSVKLEVPAERDIASHPHQQWFFNGFSIDF